MRCPRCCPAVFCGLWLAAALPAAQADPPALPKVAVTIGPKASDLERYAADQLCEYLTKLYGIKVRPTTSLPKSADIGLLVGSPDKPGRGRRAGDRRLAQLSEQGLVLKRARLEGKPVLVIGGGSPRATMWAVYELVERWGVRYLLHGDVLPERPGPFRLPDTDATLEPALTVRQWRVINEHPMGPVSWGLADYRPVLDQLAKLKFNRIFAYIWPLQPFVHYEAGGIQRRSAEIFFGFHYPITDDMPGRRLFGRRPSSGTRTCPGASYQEMRAAGERHLHGLMEYAHQRGMECMTVANLGEFPTEFAPLLKNAQKTIGVGTPTLVPGADTDPTDPALTELCTAVLRATIDTYPEVDFIELGMQEFRQWAGRYERGLAGARPQVWDREDPPPRRGAGRRRPAHRLSRRRCAGRPGGQGRHRRPLFLRSPAERPEGARKGRRPDVRFVYDSVAEELFPVLPRIVPPVPRR